MAHVPAMLTQLPRVLDELSSLHSAIQSARVSAAMEPWSQCLNWSRSPLQSQFDAELNQRLAKIRAESGVADLLASKVRPPRR